MDATTRATLTRRDAPRLALAAGAVGPFGAAPDEAAALLDAPLDPGRRQPAGVTINANAASIACPWLVAESLPWLARGDTVLVPPRPRGDAVAMYLTKLLQVRERKFLSQQELADLTGMSKPNISRLETGKQQAYPRTVRRLAEALGVAPEELVDWGAASDGDEGKAAA